MTFDPFERKPAFKAPVAPKPRRSVAASFREAIEKAEADGVSRSDMTLRLTRGDESELRRDGAVALEDISYANGQMRYLTVRVLASREAVSTLRTEPEVEEAPAPEAPAAPAKKPRAKAVRKPAAAVD